jgi:hypothetical protein
VIALTTEGDDEIKEAAEPRHLHSARAGRVAADS